MDINNELQQINTFVKGMNTDVSDALMDSSQYRYAENVRLATNTEENTGELRLVEGTAVYSHIQDYGTIKVMTSIRNLLIVITEKDSKGYILVNDTNDQNRWWVTYESEDDDSWGTYLSLVTRWESDNNVKLYIADAKHPLMYVNITEKNENGDYITHKGNKSIQGVINTFLEQPTFTIQEGGGNLNAPKIQYAYRLYKLGGSTTTLSPLSKIAVLYADDNKGYDNPTGDDVAYNINNSFVLHIPSNNSDSDYLQIFRIQYISNSGSPKISLIYDDVYISEYTDIGPQNDVDEDVSYSTFLSYIDFNSVPRIIESKNDYLFQANINDTQSKIDSKYDSVDISDYITYSLATDKSVYINSKNEKRYSINENNTRDQFKSLRLGEVYRYGAVLYDNSGNHTSVKHICDIDLAEEIQDSSVYSIQKYRQTDFYKFKLLGINFQVNWDLLLQKCPDCTAIEFVRCKRTIQDRRTITQGIAGYPLRIWKEENEEVVNKNAICSPGLISTNRFAITGHMKHSDDIPYDLEEDCQSQIGVSDSSYLIFTSPEYVYQKDDIQNILNSRNVYISRDGFIKTPNNSYTQIGEYNPGQINLRRISSQHAYDYGVPYSVYKAPNDIEHELYQWLKNHYIGDSNSQPTYGSEVPEDGTVTYIHSAWIGQYFARMIFEHGELDYPMYINRFRPKVPKVFTSYSQFVTNFSQHGVNEGYVDDVIFSSESTEDIPNPGDAFDSTTDPVSFNAGDYVLPGKNVSYLQWIIPVAFGGTNNASVLKNDQPLANPTKTDPADYQPVIAGSPGEYSIFQSRAGMFSYPIGSAGECIILKKQQPGEFYNEADNYFGAEIISIKQNIVPYGGESTIDSSIYVSYGNIFSAETGNKNYEVYDGDCFPGVFVYNSSKAWFEAPLGAGVAQSNIQAIPIYSDIDLSATFGDLVPNKTIPPSEFYWFQDIPIKIEGYQQGLYSYMYNTAYSSDPTAVPYTSIKYTKIDTGNFDCRVMYSDPKTNNEHIDSWLKFDTNNYIDVDSRFGQITNMRLFKDKLLFWQEHATGILSVNERTVLNDLENNDIVVGTGGTLQRYDYISTVYGMKPNQYDAEVQSNIAQYWWDGYNKELLAYAGGMELVPMTKTKSVTNYINQRKESNHPTLIYDNKYDEVLAQVVQNDTLVYNEQIQAFSSVYTFVPLYKAFVETDLYLANTDCIYKWNKQPNEKSSLFDAPAFPKVRIVVNKNNIYTKTFDNIIFGGRLYGGSTIAEENKIINKTNAYYIKNKDHINSPMQHLKFVFETPLKQSSSIKGDNAISVNEYDYRMAIPRNGSYATEQHSSSDVQNVERSVEYGNRMRGKTMQCEMSSDYNSTDFSLQYITTKFRMSWS